MADLLGLDPKSRNTASKLKRVYGMSESTWWEYVRTGDDKTTSSEADPLGFGYVPAPGTMALLAAGGIVSRRRRR